MGWNRAPVCGIMKAKDGGSGANQDVSKEDYPVSNWSGGKTTQLFIYPENSEYAKRNFLFRISSATVDCERSEFTSCQEWIG